MKYVITYAPDIEEILIEELKVFLFEEMRFSKIYPNFGNVRVSGIHPFAHFFDHQINGNQVPVDLFPSIIVVADNDIKVPQVDVPAFSKDIKITASEIEDIVSNRNLYIISDEDLAALQTLTENNQFVWSKGSGTVKRATISIEVWCDNIKLKNRLYDLAEAFLSGPKRYEINEKYNIKIVEESISGEKSGNYNFDFGKILYGGVIQFPVDYQINQYIVDEDIGTFDSVIHTVEEVHYAGT